MKKNGSILFILLIVAFTSCQNNHHGSRTYRGEPITIGNGQAYTFITSDVTGKPETIGIRLTAGAMSGLPTDSSEYSFMLNLPVQAANINYDHCEVDWNPHGHEPAFAYGVPHFDFHFYTISQQEQLQVIPGPDTVSIDPKYIPQDYVSGGVAVPDMGTHWVDTTAAEFHGIPFTTTFIYGAYRGKMAIFLEPMITRAFLETNPDTTMTVKQPQAFQREGYYPTGYRVRYDALHKEYVISLEGLRYP